ncbi:hypothetical protein GJ496_000216 [Pomphorhynchus laevis]|nr:hypothetical protein GJ496_000216 [Pomphorhynchus laevis]
MWCADDVSCIGEAGVLYQYFKMMKNIGPYYGFYINTQKCQLISRSNNDKARSIFAGSEILVSHLGAEVLGCPIRYDDYERKWVEHNVGKLSKMVRRLSEISETFAQQTYLAFIFALQHKWTYVFRAYKCKKSCEIRKTLKRRMSMWMDGDIPELYKEAKYLQNRITSRLHHTKNQSILVKNFTKLVVSGKLSTARQFLSSRGSRACILDLDHKIENVSVLQKLISLHPAPAEVADQHVLSKPVTGYQEHHAVRFSKVAKCDSQVAYTMLTKSLQNQWKYLQRTCEINSEWLNPLSEMIFKKLVPEIIGIPNIDMELRNIICLPLRLGGMGRMVSPIINANGSISQKSIAIEIHKENNNNMQKLQILTESISPTLQNSIKHACLKGASSWLSTLPIDHKGFHLRKRAFQDAIAVRYGWDPIDLPRKCSFIPKTNVIHAL